MLVRKAGINDFRDALKLVKITGCDVYARRLLAKKAVFIPVAVENIDNRAANILKQEALACGADAAVSENVSRFKKGFSNALIFATAKQLETLAAKLALQPFGLKEAARGIASIYEEAVSEKRVFRYKKAFLDLCTPAIMGIINVSPDSFSGDGLSDPAAAAAKAEEFENYGAKIIDLGAESSRPGAKPAGAKEEIKRLIPALKRIKKAVKIPVSVDTYRYETAQAALSEGADIINDIYALRSGKEKLAELIADTKAGVILMHMKGTPENMQKKPSYKNCVSEVFEFLRERKKFALSCGIEEDFISVDSGIGFGKTAEHNFELVKNMRAFSLLGAVTAGVSRKSFVKAAAGEEKYAFVAANFAAASNGADIVRVHDVKETAAALKFLVGLRAI
ncbi:MAG: dihydropteroate synthase [Endomicrobia bacterium]|nr:dihydropteroate synthase [Endomicrobiia bacterium]